MFLQSLLPIGVSKSWMWHIYTVPFRAGRLLFRYPLPLGGGSLATQATQQEEHPRPPSCLIAPRPGPAGLWLSMCGGIAAQSQQHPSLCRTITTKQAVFAIKRNQIFILLRSFTLWPQSSDHHRRQTVSERQAGHSLDQAE